MGTFITLVIIGSVLLAVSISILIYWNYSEATVAKLIAIVLSGLIVTVITLFLSLKQSETKESFIIYSLIDTNTNTPLSFEQLESIINAKHAKSIDDLLAITIQEEKTNLHRIVGNISSSVNYCIYQDSSYQKPLNDSQLLNLCLDAIQYQIIKDIMFLHKGNYYPELSYNNSPDQPTFFRKNIRDNFNFSNSSDITAKLLPQLQKNIIYRNSIEKVFFEKKAFDLPKNTDVLLKNRESDRIIEIFKKNFYNLSINIEKFDSKKGMLPDGLKIKASNEELQFIEIQCFRVNLNTKFFKMTSQNKNTVEYKKWIDWLFNEFRLLYDHTSIY